MEKGNEIKAAYDIGRGEMRVADRITTVDGIPVVLDNHDGEEHVRVLDDLLEARERLGSAPRRRKGSLTLTELDSFVEYVNRQRARHELSTVCVADVAKMALRVCFNAHDVSGDAGWGDDLVFYTCPVAPEWDFWQKKSGQQMTQVQFAELLDARLEDIVGGDGTKYPAPPALLEMARDLMIETKGTYKRKIDPVLGTGVLLQETDHGPLATKIPRAFGLGLRVFEGGRRHAVEARVAFKLGESGPLFSATLHRAEEVKREAFSEVRKVVGEKCKVPVFAGTW